MNVKVKTVKSEKDFVTWIRKQIDYYLPILHLQFNEVDIERAEDDEDSYMEIVCTYPYHDPTIRYSHKLLLDWQQGKVKKQVVLHELVHILTDPLYVKATNRYVGKNELADERERLTDMISIIIRSIL